MNGHVIELARRLRVEMGALGATDRIELRTSLDPAPFRQTERDMEERVAAISAGRSPESIWFLEHPALYTAGTSAKAADLIDGSRFPVFETGRGGQYTYHGPGQLVAYAMLDLNSRGRDVRGHVHRLEAWVIAALSTYGVRGERRVGRPGIWVLADGGGMQGGVTDAKIAAIGVRVRRWVTYHGVSVNVCPDLSHFNGIVPCGIADAGVTSLEALGAL